MNEYDYLACVADTIMLCDRMDKEVQTKEDLNKPIVQEYLHMFDTIDEKAKIFYHYGIMPSVGEKKRKFYKLVAQAHEEFLKPRYIECVKAKETATDIIFPLEDHFITVGGKNWNMYYDSEEIEEFVRSLVSYDCDLKLAVKKYIVNEKLKRMEEDF